MNVKDELKKAIKHGINLGILTPEEEQEALMELMTFLINKKNFCLHWMEI